MSDPYKVAEAKIAAALSELELATDCWVEGIAVRDEEITSVHDHRRRFARRVQINVRGRPGSAWVQRPEGA